MTRIDLKSDACVPWELLGKIVPWVSPSYNLSMYCKASNVSHFKTCNLSNRSGTLRGLVSNYVTVLTKSFCFRTFVKDRSSSLFWALLDIPAYFDSCVQRLTIVTGIQTRISGWGPASNGRNGGHDRGLLSATPKRRTRGAQVMNYIKKR